MPMIAFGVMYGAISKNGLKESRLFSLPFDMPPQNADEIVKPNHPISCKMPVQIRG
jgi:hypothetical protein